MHIVRGTDEYTVAEGHDWFWKIFEDGTWEPTTFKIFDKILKPKSVMLDIGAWIGPTSLYAAKRARQIFAFEPDPVAFTSLVQNLALNHVDNVIPYPVAVSNAWKGIPFGIKTTLGDSMSSELWSKDDKKVAAVAFEALVAEIKPDFIKIDIEGGEAALLGGSRLVLETFKPTLHLSLHTPWFKDDLKSFKVRITQGVGMYPYIYDENLNRIELKDAFDTGSFNAIVASFTEIV